MMEFLGIKDKLKLGAKKTDPFEETKKEPQDQVDTVEDNSQNLLSVRRYSDLQRFNSASLSSELGGR